MLLQTLRVHNFRQFYGDCEVSFSTDPNQNITLIHGENGVGKTTLLNAILWCLFEHLTPDFERPDELLNVEAKKERSRTCKVEIEFEHEKLRYLAQRHLLEDGKSRLKVFLIENHNFKELPSPVGFVNSVLPRDMAPYFFFHGEGIASINEAKGGEKFRKAIRDILGFTFAETAIEDLRRISARLNRDLSLIGEREKTFSRAAGRRAQAEEALLDLEKQLDAVKGEIDHQSSSVADLESRLERTGNADASRIKNEIGTCARRVDAASRALREVDLERQSMIAKYGWAVLGTRLMTKAIEFIDEKTLSGRIPSPYQEKFVQDLLTAGECICGSPIPDGSTGREKVLALLETANTAIIQQRVMKARSTASNMQGRLSEFVDEANRLELRKSTLDATLGKEEQTKKDLESELDRIDEAAIREITDLRRKAITKRDDALLRKGRLEEQKNQQEATIRTAKQEMASQASSNKEQNRLNDIQDFVDAMVERCKSHLEGYENSSRTTIATIVNSILESFSRKDYAIRVTQEFDFHMVRNDGGIVAKSKGEKLLLNLAFVAALIELAKMRQNASGRFLVQGTAAPFVIDAPFGELDETYKEATANFLPNKVPQLVLLLSSGHWKGTVDQTIRNRIGSEYVLVSHRRIARGSKPEDQIKIGTRSYRQSLYSSERDRTSIERVS